MKKQNILKTKNQNHNLNNYSIKSPHLNYYSHKIGMKRSFSHDCVDLFHNKYLEGKYQRKKYVDADYTQPFYNVPFTVEQKFESDFRVDASTKKDLFFNKENFKKKFSDASLFQKSDRKFSNNHNSSNYDLNVLSSINHEKNSIKLHEINKTDKQDFIMQNHLKEIINLNPIVNYTDIINKGRKHNLGDHIYTYKIPCFGFDTQNIQEIRHDIRGLNYYRPMRMYNKPEIGHDSTNIRNKTRIIDLRNRIKLNYFNTTEENFFKIQFKWAYIHYSLYKNRYNIKQNNKGVSNSSETFLKESSYIKLIEPENFYDKKKVLKNIDIGITVQEISENSQFLKGLEIHKRLQESNHPLNSCNNNVIKNNNRYENKFQNSRSINKIENKKTNFNNYASFNSHNEDLTNVVIKSSASESNLNDTLSQKIIEQIAQRKILEYSVLRRILEGDDVSSRYMKLMVIQIEKNRIRLFDGYFDSWFKIDLDIKRCILNRKIQIGTILKIFGAKLIVECKYFFEINNKESSFEINYNNVRISKRTRKLGYQKKKFHVTYLNTLSKTGGDICGLELKIKKIISSNVFIKVHNYSVTISENKLEQELEKINEMVEKSNFDGPLEWTIKRFTKLIMCDKFGNECLFTWMNSEIVKVGEIYRFLSLRIYSKDLGIHISTQNKTYIEKIAMFK
ncbi:hypothetical protein EDEG_00753 [Edhazardia aedis USNM 41457]|uniref:BRCA2 OB1 domain-containing protein n=1 Tax=Edhazardia aedis (strain USNM 41457) TaxID=1003232 RepID=J9DV32_EDHAE|nr:hypothetical protein EDEG_00753 [Edhazardia aedis USNM 41457]|eukprot:EJW05142.1 hypothetical protein EDEG_00753 [Edhazardia aedis USNM 41457]